MPRSPEVDAYIAAAPEGARTTLELLRTTIAALAPDAVEAISYGLPTFKYRGKALIHFGATKKHRALYGAVPVEHRELLAAFDTSKGTIRFPYDAPPSKEIIETLVRTRVAAIDAGPGGKRG